MNRTLRIRLLILTLGLMAWQPVACAQTKTNPGMKSATIYTNRLINEKSPYLQQHAHNPVNWYPWGEEAFSKARKENKPIFLSIGYSTCHWCHVMEHESFEDTGVAKILNDNFISIKVDREERPDIDGVYMTFVQATTGGGGWPMSVWLTPKLKPFFGGTYFPRDQFLALLQRIIAAWKDDPEKLVASADNIIGQLRQNSEPKDADTTEFGDGLLTKAYEQIKSSYEPQYGGFGVAPKFPRPVIVNYLLRYYAQTGAKAALDMSLFTLRRMAEGGIHDHIGGGFHRYSTDTRWHVPHFEKMLYDQAQLANSYLDAYQITHDEFYAGVARDILAYVARDMTGDQGQFYSAEDADSPVPKNPSTHAEGALYVWEEKEIVEALGSQSAEIFKYYFGVGEHGNVTSDPRGELVNKNVLIVSHSIEEVAKHFHKTPQEVQALLASARQSLFAIRAKRPRPHRDDKTITAWNGLMISAFARAYQVMGEPHYLSSAIRAAQFIKTKLYDPKSQKLMRRFRDGEAAVDGFADDYAFLIQGLLDLYEASFNIEYLSWALDLQRKQNEIFWDTIHSGYFSTAGTDPSILIRMKEDYDGAEPSPNSVSALNLLRLSEMLDEQSFYEMAEKTFIAFSDQLKTSPSAMPQLMVALDFQAGHPKQIVIAGTLDAPDTRAMLQTIYEKFIPGKILLFADGGSGQTFLGKHLEFIRDVKPINSKATAFVCQNYVCQKPTNSVADLAKLLTIKVQPPMNSH
jgi:uncharacterized protein YyaL (SSP411 family)